MSNEKQINNKVNALWDELEGYVGDNAFIRKLRKDVRRFRDFSGLNPAMKSSGLRDVSKEQEAKKQQKVKEKAKVEKKQSLTAKELDDKYNMKQLRSMAKGKVEGYGKLSKMELAEELAKLQ